MDAGPPPEEPVPLADAAIAADIARAAARGRGADRAPTLEQLLAAFGEAEPTFDARRRASRALALARVGATPDVMDVAPGERVVLSAAGGGGGRRAPRVLLGLAAVVLVLAAAAAAATLTKDDRSSLDDSLPSRATTPAVTLPASVTTQATTAGTTTTATQGTPVDTTATTPAQTATTDADSAAARRRRAAQERRRRAAAAAAERRRSVTVRVDASAAPTYLCVDDGAGRQLFAGTLSGSRTFSGRRVRLNVGLASTVVTVDGTRVALPGSPAGLDVTRAGGAQPLALGSRPCA